MSVHSARIIKGAFVAPSAAHEESDVEPATRRWRVSRFELDTRETAERLITEAEATKAKILADAAIEARGAREHAVTEAKAEEEAKFAAHYMALQLERDGNLARETDRLMQLATVMAERLVGEELAVRPERIRVLAQEAIAEARGASALTLEAHPDDAEALRALLHQLRSGATLSVRESTELARGSLLVHTELGTLDARLRPQLDRLATHLGALLRAG